MSALVHVVCGLCGADFHLAASDLLSTAPSPQWDKNVTYPIASCRHCLPEVRVKRGGIRYRTSGDG